MVQHLKRYCTVRLQHNYMYSCTYGGIVECRLALLQSHVITKTYNVSVSFANV